MTSEVMDIPNSAYYRSTWVAYVPGMGGIWRELIEVTSTSPNDYYPLRIVVFGLDATGRLISKRATPQSADDVDDLRRKLTSILSLDDDTLRLIRNLLETAKSRSR